MIELAVERHKSYVFQGGKNDASDASSYKTTVYALRRILVRRLQAASQGVSRRARFDQHRRFAKEWEACLREGRLTVLRQLMSGEDGHQGEEQLPAGVGLLVELARGEQELGVDVKTVLAGAPPGLAFWKAHTGSSERPDESPTASAEPQHLKVRNVALQGDLFGSGLATQPL